MQRLKKKIILKVQHVFPVMCTRLMVLCRTLELFFFQDMKQYYLYTERVQHVFQVICTCSMVLCTTTEPLFRTRSSVKYTQNPIIRLQYVFPVTYACLMVLGTTIEPIFRTRSSLIYTQNLVLRAYMFPLLCVCACNFSTRQYKTKMEIYSQK